MYSILGKRRVFKWCIIGVICWLLLHKKKYSIQLDYVLKLTEPVHVWEYVADFSNMKNLNPTIIDFSVEEESGNYDHWQYTVHYTEFLSHLPFVVNYAVAHYQVKPLSKNRYVIFSVHQTCFYSSLFCVDSESSFTFESQQTSTLCTEEITYECPMILSKLCANEVWYQRQVIMKNLQKALSKP